MPILKVNQGGEWKDISSSYNHRHSMEDIIDFPTNIVNEVEDLKDKIGTLNDQNVEGFVHTVIDAKNAEILADIELLAEKTFVIDEIANVNNKFEDYALKTEVPSIEGLATETYVNEKIAEIDVTEQLSDYALKTYVQEEIAKVDVSDQLEGLATKEQLGDYALKTEVPSIEGLATETYVQQQIGAIPDVDLTGYATETYVKNEIANASISGGGGGVSSWNDLTDKPFGVEFTETKEKVILAETTLSGFAYNSDMAAFRYRGTDAVPALYTLKADKEYTVVWDGEAFTRTTFAFTFADGSECVGIGNALAAGGSDSGEPFCIVYDKTNSQLHYLSTEQDASHTVSVAIAVTETSETRLDSKYMSILTPAAIDVVSEQTIPMSMTYANAENHYKLMTDEDQQSELFDMLSSIEPGQLYQIVWNGVEYSCAAQDLSDSLPSTYVVNKAVFLGNMYVQDYDPANDTGEPFCIVIADVVDDTGAQIQRGGQFLAFPTDEEVENALTTSDWDQCHRTVCIRRFEDKLDEKFIPDTLVTDTELKEAIANIETSGSGGSGGVSSWNDLTDKPFGVEITEEVEKVFLPEMTFTSQTYIGLEQFGYMYRILDRQYELTIGNIYTVKWGEDEYTCTALDGSSFGEDYSGAVFIGNGSAFGLAGGNDTAPFVIGTIDGSLIIVCLQDTQNQQPAEHTVSITATITKTYETQLDNKYLSILDYVESAVIFDGSVQASAADTGTMIVADSSDATLVAGQTYKVTWNGEVYECECIEQGGLTGIGNVDMFDGTGDNGIPFVIGRDPTGALLGISTGVWLIFPTAILTETVTSMDVDCKIELKSDYYKLKAGVASWNDLADKPFGEKIANAELVAATDVTFEYDISNYFYEAELSVSPDLWQSNFATAKVTYGDTVYDCTVTILEGMKHFGNFGKFTGQASDNGMPFFCYAPVDNTTGKALIYGYSNEPTILIPKRTSLSVTQVDNYYAHEFSDVLSFADGLEYHVMLLNNGTYISNSDSKKITAASYTSDDGTYVGIGNPSILGLGDDNSEKYFIFTKTATDGTQTSSLIVTTSTSTVQASLVHAPNVTHNISISIDQEVIVPLDSKYLPADLSGLPEVTTDDNGKILAVNADGEWEVNSSIIEELATEAYVDEKVGAITFEQVQADWNETDSASSAYINNRPFGYLADIYNTGQYDLILNFHEDTNSYWCQVYSSWMSLLEEGGTYIVTWDDVPFVCQAMKYTVVNTVVSNSYRTMGLGNPMLLVVDNYVKDAVATEYPFFICNGMISTNDTSTEYHRLVVTPVAKLNHEFLPNNIATKEYVDNKIILPEVTSDDAGKFLRVSSTGAWAVEAITNAEEASF